MSKHNHPKPIAPNKSAKTPATAPAAPARQPEPAKPTKHQQGTHPIHPDKFRNAKQAGNAPSMGHHNARHGAPTTQQNTITTGADTADGTKKSSRPPHVPPRSETVRLSPSSGVADRGK